LTPPLFHNALSIDVEGAFFLPKSPPFPMMFEQ
jgi:hypothetical protein